MKYKILVFLFLFIASSMLLNAQEHQKTSPVENDSLMHNLHTTIIPSAGYSLQTNWAAAININIAFYTQPKTDTNRKFSTINTSLTYTTNHQLMFPIQANISSKNNKYYYITDFRYLQYPSFTYGLGANSSIDNGYTLNYNYIKLHETVLKSVYPNLYAGLGFYYDAYWNIEQIDKPNGEITSFDRYGYSPEEKAVGFAAKLMYDSRLNQINPQNGWYGNIIYRPNFSALGGDNNWQSLLIEARKYIHLSKYSKNILALWSYNWFTMSGKPPYLFLPSTSWDDLYNTGRGYIQGRYRSKNMMYLEAEYRFGISRNGLFGGVVFANAQSFSKDIKTELSVIAPGYGAGIRIRVNKHSGANLCIDYAFGKDGSKGIFVNLGEVF